MKGNGFVIVSLGAVFFPCRRPFFFVGRLFVECNYAIARIILDVWGDPCNLFEYAPD
jgi:hypothetical protein